jgi:thiamine-monophosphate kinase
MRVADIGEFGLIERLAGIVAAERSDVLVGVGDDAAVLADHEGDLLLATVDSHLEYIHFLPYLLSPAQLGRRALVVNLSDIAAMGGQPRFALVSLRLPADQQVEWVEEFYRGMRAEADRAGVAIVGGNITRSPAGVGVDITVLGRVRREHLLLRSGARVGDMLLVTGDVGAAFAGLQLAFKPRLPVPAALREELISRYIAPEPRLAEAAIIAHSGQASAMLDVSDGLSSDIGHLCERSGVGVQVQAAQLPIAAATQQVAEALGVPAWRLALAGGDDYGLCFTAPPAAVAALREEIGRETGTSITAVGEIRPAEQGRHVLLPDGQVVPLAASGWQHFGTADA